MKVGYAVLYEDGDLVISKDHTILQKPILEDYGEFDDTDVPWAWGKDDNCFNIVQVWILDQVKSNCMYEWFYHCYNLTTLLDFHNLDVSDCKDFSDTFWYCEHLINISSLSNWNLSNGENFSNMFYGCYSLTNLSTLQNWDVSNGIDFREMFRSCKSLRSISSLKNWDVSNGKNFSYMFCACNSLTNISSLKNWNISSGKAFKHMFAYCKSLKDISLSNTLDILRKNMFLNCNENLKIHWKNKIYTYEDLILYNEF